MSKDFSRSFYNSTKWKRTAEEYKDKQNGLCEECCKKGLIVPGNIVHHKAELTPNNINDESITLNHNNLQLLCRTCHLQAHGRNSITHKRYTIDAEGRVTMI